MGLLGHETFDTNILFVHRGVLPPKSGIGEHIHRTMEEMYIVLDGPAEFTVNGHTSFLPAGSSALCQKKSSHGIYNPTDKPVNFINLAVSDVKGEYDNVDYNDDLSDAKLESPAAFLWGNFDKSLLRPFRGAHEGAGEIMFRRVWSDENFLTNWFFIDHCVLPPGTSIGYHQHNTIEEVYYVMSGNGRMTVNDKTWDVGAGDAVPCTLHDSHGLYNNTDENLEIFVFSAKLDKNRAPEVVNHGDDLSGR
jgi:mannose-6-phosphate isomerase-like protein (cupin superfamily)